jgi:hypothetical protein
MSLVGLAEVLADALFNGKINYIEVDQGQKQIIAGVPGSSSPGANDAISALGERLKEYGFAWVNADSREDDSVEWHLFKLKQENQSGEE